MEAKVGAQIPNPMTSATTDPMSQGATDSVVTSLGQIEKWVEDRVKLKFPVNQVPIEVIEALTRVQKQLEGARVEFEYLVRLVQGQPTGN